MAPDAPFVGHHQFLRFIIRFLRRRAVAGEAVLEAEGLVHAHHFRVFAVAFGAGESRIGRYRQRKKGKEYHRSRFHERIIQQVWGAVSMIYIIEKRWSECSSVRVKTVIDNIEMMP